MIRLGSDKKIYRPQMIVDVRCYIHLRWSCYYLIIIILKCWFLMQQWLWAGANAIFLRSAAQPPSRPTSHRWSQQDKTTDNTFTSFKGQNHKLTNTKITFTQTHNHINSQPTAHRHHTGSSQHDKTTANTFTSWKAQNHKHNNNIQTITSIPTNTTPGRHNKTRQDNGQNTE